MLIAIGSIFGILGVGLGAFGAHALRERLTQERMAVFQTAVQYQMYHSIAILVAGTMFIVIHPTVRLFAAGGWWFVVGILLFSGSLYALCTTGIRKLGAITPLGGLAFLIGWASIFLGALHL